MGGLFDNPLHLVLLIVVIVLLFGASKLGDVGGALGKSIREFKKEASKDEEHKAARGQTPPASTYVPPAVQSHVAEPPAVEPARRPEYAPGDYRPTAPQTPPPAVGSVPPDYSGR